MENALRSLRDIDGVLGSFLVEDSGELLARDMPGIFDEPTLRSASQRLSQMRAAFEADGQAFDGCVARFGGHLLVLRSAERRTLCVLCPVGTNMNTLQMGLNLVARRAHDVAPRASLPPPARASAPPPMPAPAPVVASPSSHGQRPSSPPSLSLPLASPEPSADPSSEPQSITRFFRGRPVP